MKRRYIQLPGGELKEVGLYEKIGDVRNSDSLLWNDKSYQGVDSRFSSRSSHREYMKINGLTTADDYKGEWKEKAKGRDKHYTIGSEHESRRGDVEKAIHSLETRRKKHG